MTKREDIFETLLEDFLGLARSKSSTSNGLWREQPVDLITFFKDYLKEAPYPGKQTELLEAVDKVLWWKVTGDKSLCPDDLREITEMAVLFGKGSGKDFIASGILAYVCYLLCCMNDPQEFAGFGQDEPIDLINVAINAYQANNVFFKKLKARITNCKWFVRVNGTPERPNEYQLTKNQIRFYRNITAHSAHSEGDSYEGFNPFVVIFDEIGGFEINAANEIYHTLRSSAISRYNNRALLIFISYPRHADDFIMKKYKEAMENKDPQVWAIRGKSWEVNPKIDKASLAKDYERDPEGSKIRYECEPPAVAEGFFQFPEKIDNVIKVGKTSQCGDLIIQNKVTTRTLQSGEQRHFIGKEIFNLRLDPSFTYYLGGDGGVNTDSYVISLFHAEPTIMTVVNEQGVVEEKWVNKPVEDLLIEWRPSKKDRLPVDLLNVADILEQICAQVFVKKALFDKFNSAEVVQRLINRGVEAEDKNFSNPFQLQIYTNLKSYIYTGNIELLDHVSLDEKRLNANEELKYLKLINGNKIDHDPDKSKDFSDARAAAVWICTTDEVIPPTHFSMPILAGAKRRTGDKIRRRT